MVLPSSTRDCFILLAIISVLVSVTHGHLVDYVLNKLTMNIVEADTRWAASVESGRCYMVADEARGGPSQWPLAQLLTHIADKELSACVPSVIFDRSLPMAGSRDDIFSILSTVPIPMLVGGLMKPTTPSWMPQPPVYRNSQQYPGSWQEVTGNHDWKCRSYIVIVDDVVGAMDVIGKASKERVVVVTRSPLWRIRDFLSGPQARQTLNLLVVQDRNWKRNDPKQGFVDINLMTHRVFGDSLGGSFPQILTSWRCDHFTRPWVRIFPQKMLQGFSGHQFKVAAADSPPYVFKTTTADLESTWDGYEVRVMNLLAGVLNFTVDFREPVLETGDRSGILAATRVVREVLTGAAEVGVGGVYITTDRLAVLDMPQQHTQDCAAFMTLASVALPRYRAILGPFQWTVWLAVSLAYVLAIIPLVFSHHLSLRLLIRHPGQIENMFWYVFGTFTNLFQFKGQDTWVGSKRDSTRMIVGWYWVFSIIVTACYTGSVISFIAFPVFPALVENMKDVMDGGYRVGTLDNGGWTTWFLNSSDPKTDKLLRNVDLVSTVWQGIQNMTHASFFHPYSFLGSRLYLEYVVRTNYSAQDKRSRVHIGEDCFVPFWVSFIFPRDAVYSERLSHMTLRAIQSGLVGREKRNVRWDTQRASSGALLQASPGASLRIITSEERVLTLDDTQGMFLLFGIGVVMASCALTAENVVGRVSSLRKRCPPGPRRRSSVGLDPLWLAGSRCSSATFDKKEFDETEDRSKHPAHGKFRRSVNSLPDNILEQTEEIVKSRSHSVATAPPIVRIETTHSMDDLYEAACLKNLDESEEQILQKDFGDSRSNSMFSWVSSLAAKFNRQSQAHDPFLGSDSTNATHAPSESEPIEQDRQSSPTKTYTVEPNFRDFETNPEREEPNFVDIQSVFGSRQGVEDFNQPNIPDESTRLSSLELLKPLKRTEAEEAQGARKDLPDREVDKTEQSTLNNLKVGQLTLSQEVKPTSAGPIEVVTEDVSKSKPPEADRSRTLTGSTKLHHRTPSTFTRTQTSESRKKLLRVPRTFSRLK